MSSVSIITNSLLELDVKNVYNKAMSQNIKKVTYTAVLHSPCFDYTIEILHFVETKRDYDSFIGDDVRVKFNMDPSIYRQKFMNFENNLEMTLIKDRGGVNHTKRYKCRIHKSNIDDNRPVYEDLTDDSLAERMLAEIEVECIDITLYNRMYNTTESVYTNNNIEAVMYSEFIKLFINTDTEVDMIEPDNKNTYGFISIPTGTRVLDLPTVLQNDDTHGVYNGGVGTYFQSRYRSKDKSYFDYIFIYPLNDFKRFENGTTNGRVMFLHSKDLKAGQGDFNHCIDGNILKIVPKYDYTFYDRGETNSKDAIVSVDPDNITKSVRDIDNGNTIYGDKDNNLTVTAGRNKLDNNYSVDYVGVTNNLYKYRSNQIANSIAIYDLTWEHSDIDLIYPGMPCQFIYEDKAGKLLKLSGQVKGTYEMYNAATKETKGVVRIGVISPTVYIGSQYDEQIGIR